MSLTPPLIHTHTKKTTISLILKDTNPRENGIETSNMGVAGGNLNVNRLYITISYGLYGNLIENGDQEFKIHCYAKFMYIKGMKIKHEL